MTWRKLGHVFRPSGERAWARSHAFIPTAHVTSRGELRVYFTGLDAQRFGRVGFVDLDPDDPTRVIGECTEPVLDLGPIGAFDDSGVNASAVVECEGSVHLYYIGWQRAERVPYMLFTGLARARDAAGPFERAQAVPVLDRTPEEPYSRSAPCVRRDGDRWHAWYWSCERWTSDEIGVHYNNVIRHAESPDGVHWTSSGPPLLVPAGDDYSLGRPWVVRDADRFRMWFSVRSRTRPYRMGYAESEDGVTWSRCDAVGALPASASGWDAEMVCFPCVVDVAGRRLMFYNGNGHGATGFGVAALEGHG